jgi:segregation and condensation protein B
MDSKQLDDIVLAVLFASDEALNVKRIESVLDDVTPQEIKESLKRLAEVYGNDQSVIRLEQVAGGHQLSTSPRFSEYVARLYRGRRKQRLSKASMETLAIIAYKQPVTRADIENIRGVGCGGVVTTLMERSLIRIVGKAKVLGSPFLYGTTQEFLEYLGLNSLKELPSHEELEALLTEETEPEDENGLFAGGITGMPSEKDAEAEAGRNDEEGGDVAPENPAGNAGEDGTKTFDVSENDQDDAAGERMGETVEIDSGQTMEIESSDDNPAEKKDPA